MSKTDTTARMHRDGTVVEVRPDGTERPFPDTPMRPMTEEEFQRARKVPRAKTLRRAKGAPAIVDQKFKRPLAHVGALQRLMQPGRSPGRGPSSKIALHNSNAATPMLHFLKDGFDLFRF
jgi:hypothetical protein